ncbi:hypothetical protein WA026_001822 [Henosepilachna vigintioctopunctata]|uniref:Uncharacterized protein n=1 Tax=Henosepilachna vigintioctopunctata TaxID=420089 RepID=A0AAW1UUI5_9CUCU
MQLEFYTMTKVLVLVLLVSFMCFSQYDCALECQKCNTTEDTTNCKYGGKIIVDRDDECPPGKSTCFRMTYVSKCNSKKVYRRGCDGPDFCQQQRRRNDIDVDICEQCDDNTYCNTATLY